MRIDRVELNADRSLLRAVEVSGVRDEPALNRATQPISTLAAIEKTLAESSERLVAQAVADRGHDAVQERRSAALAV